MCYCNDMTNNKKHNKESAAVMTEAEIERAIFKNAGPSELRGIRDAFTEDAILKIAERCIIYGELDWHHWAVQSACNIASL